MLPHWTENDLLINEVQLHYYRTGHGERPPVVLVHGFSDNGLCWTPVARALEADYDLILPDMRGHGLSARVQVGEKVEMSADLAGLIRALGLKDPVVVGHSMGAMVTYQLGLRFPELARALVLEDPPWWLPESVQSPAANELAEPPIAQWAKGLANLTLEDLFLQTRQEHPSWPEELVRPMCESKKQLDPRIIESMVAKMHSQDENWLTTLQNLTQPTLLFTGNPALGGLVTPEVVAKVRELNPKVAITTFPETGHLIRFDQYTAFMETLRAFLKQVLG
jgi:pimeloyl-ACP methyl ester carboxylesterase